MSMASASVTPTLDTFIYAPGDQLSTGADTLNTSASSKRVVQFLSITVLDKDSQAKPFDILFFNAAPTIASVVNAALDVSDAEMAAKFVGRATVAAADYTTLVSSKVATIQPVNLAMTAGAGGALWVVLLSQGTGIYTASGLQVTFTMSTEV